MRSIAAGLPANDPARRVLSSSANKHATAALAHVASGDYAGEHWLASFAVFLLLNWTFLINAKAFASFSWVYAEGVGADSNPGLRRRRSLIPAQG